MLSVDPIISEFMPANEDTLLDGNGVASDWIEVFNPTQAPIDLAGWHLTDDALDLDKWTFPNTVLAPGQYLVVFASGSGLTDPAGNLHTNFQLNADGDYLALVKPNGTTIASEFGSGGTQFPPLGEDISYGRGQSTSTTTFVSSGANATALVPTQANGGDLLDGSWTGAAANEPFDDSTWIAGTTGVGYGDFSPPIQIAGELFVDLDASDGSAGTATWNNAGTLGNFTRVGAPTLVTFDGRAGVRFNNTATLDVYQSPVNAPAGLVGLNPTRTIEAWVYNPTIADEETVVAWARRGGPAGTNMSFNYGTNVNFGAIGHWDAPDIGWGSVPPAGQWNHLVYTYDGTTTRVYSNGVLTNSEVLGAGVINTTGGTRITLAAQLEANGTTINTALRGTLTIGKLRIHDGVLSAEQVARNYELERPLYPIPPPPTPAPLTAAPSHRYSFNDGTANDSVGTLHGTPNGATYAGGAVNFSGANQYVDFGGNDIAALGAVNGAVTIEAWGTYGAATATWARVFDFGDTNTGTGNGRNYVFLTPRSGAAGTRAAISNMDPGFNGENIAEGTLTATGSASHWVIVFDDTNDSLTMYLNGNPASGNTMTIPLSAVSNLRGYLGRSLYNPDPYLVGSIDEFRIYNYALTRNQALGNFQAGPNTVNLPALAPAGLEAPPIGTVIDGAMQGVNASAFIRIPFNVADPTIYNALTLRNQYDDGFVAYVNGVEVARRNAPAAVAWNSAATAARSVDEAITPEDINISSFLSALRPGENILAIHGLNVSTADADLLILPELIAATITTGSPPRYFTVPTPRASNSAGVIDFVADTQFDIDRGFFDAPIDVTVSTTTPGASFAYTTDGSEPTLNHGTQLPSTKPPDAPSEATIHIAATTPLRVRAFKLDFEPTNIDTHTYIFLDDVVNNQSMSAVLSRGFPSTWGPNVVDYEVDPDVTTNPLYAATFKNDLKTIPSVAIVADLDDLFGTTNGVYANAQQRGDQWEQPTSIEWIDPNDPLNTYQENGGLRAFGGVGRTPGRGKHSLRVVFREDYGAAKGHFPVFPDTDVEDHNSIVLKMNWNYSWTGDSTAAGGLGTQFADYLRDVYGRDTARDMGMPVAHGRPVHLYVNGLYWGLYHAIERTDEHWAAETFGGSQDDYDILKPVAESFAAVPIEIVAGERTAWDQLMAAATQNLTVPANYNAVAQLVDIDQLIDYMLLVFFTGSRDAPTLLGTTSEPRNFWAIRNRAENGKWQFLAWDVEWSLEQTTVDRVNVNYSGGHDNPAYLFDKLLANSDFKVRVADRIQKHFFNGGALSREVAMARYQARANEIDRAIIGESARWGDTLRPALPYTRADWLSEVNRIVNTYLSGRTATVLTQLIGTNIAGAKKLFPDVGSPQMLIDGQPQFGGEVSAGAQLSLTDPNNPVGQIYYTLDGTDPRMLPSQVGSTVILSETSPAKALVPKVSNGGDQLGATWKGAAANEPFNDSAWLSSAAGAGVGYDTTTSPVDYNPLISINVQADMTTAPTNPSVFIRVPFNMPNQASIDALGSLTLRMKFDDGIVAYLNGQEVARNAAPGGTPLWSAPATLPRSDSAAVNFADFAIAVGTPQALLRVGTNILAIQGLNRTATDGDCVFVPQLVATLRDVAATAIPYTGPVALPASTNVNARIKRGLTWSALASTLFTVDVPVRVSEIMYHPGDRTAAEIAAGFTNDDDFEYLELTNTSAATPFNLAGMHFVDGIQFALGSYLMQPLERVVVVRNHAAFQFRYGAGVTIVGVYGGTPDNVKLSNSGEVITLLDAAGGPVQSFRYDADWYPTTDGTGPSLTIVDLGQTLDQWSVAEGWRPSYRPNGTPGADDPQPATVEGRRVFYNNSAWDGNDATANAGDDGAIATDKAALLPGGAATLANYTSYNKGINGVMIDVAHLAGTITAGDFVFKTGNSNNTVTWTVPATAPSVSVRPGAGVNGSDRVTLIWLDGLIKKQWLQVKLLANGNTGLLADDAFYFGNAIGEAGNSAIDAQVNAADELAARGNPRNIANPAPISFLFDYNRDKQVNAADQLVSRGNPTNLATRLLLIVPTAAAAPAAAALADAALVAVADGDDPLARRARKR